MQRDTILHFPAGYRGTQEISTTSDVLIERHIMGAGWSASEESSGNKQGLPDLSQLHTTPPAVIDPVPELLPNEPQRSTALFPKLPNEVNLMIREYAKEMWQDEQEKWKLEREKRNIQAMALENWPYNFFLKRTQRWSLAEFCELLGNENFQEWILTDYVKRDPLRKGDIENAVYRVLWHYAYYATIPNNSELKQKLKVIEDKIETGQYVANDHQALKDLFELANLLCRDPGYESVRSKVHEPKAKPRRWM